MQATMWAMGLVVAVGPPATACHAQLLQLLPTSLPSRASLDLASG